MQSSDDDTEPRVERTWPLVRLDSDGRPMWAVMGSNPP